MNGWSLRVWFPPWSMDEVVWWCVGLLCWWHCQWFYLEFKAHLTSIATTAFCSDTPVPLSVNQMGYHLFFNRKMTQHISRLCKKESDRVLHQMTWPPQSPDLNPFEMVWQELDRRVKEKQHTSAQHLMISSSKIYRDMIPEKGGKSELLSNT